MRNIIVIIFYLFSLSGCKSDNHQTNDLLTIKSKFPILLNINNVDTKSFLDLEENPTWLSTAYYQFYYLGKLADTITIKNKIYFSTPEPPPLKNSKSKYIEHKKQYSDYYIEWDKENPYKLSLDTLIEIQPNNSITIKNTFPVLIKNKNKDTVTIGYGSQIPMIMEAMDSTGNWKPIQEKFTYMCGNGVGSIILPPDEIAITFAPNFKGTYKTQIRLTLGRNKSKPFVGHINYRQFTSKYNENGDYQEEYKQEEQNKKKTTNR